MICNAQRNHDFVWKTFFFSFKKLRLINIKKLFLNKKDFLKACNVGHGSGLWKNEIFIKVKKCLRVQRHRITCSM
jgi:hypothetical protein